MPALHGVGVVEPGKQNCPAGHGRQPSALSTPVALWYVPPGQGAATGLPGKQYVATGHVTGVTVARPQNEPAGHTPVHCGLGEPEALP